MQGWRILIWAILVVIVLFFLWLVRGILLPFIVAFVIATLLEPIVRRLRLRGFSRKAAVAITMGGFVVVVVAGGILIAPTVVRQVSGITTRAGELTKNIAETNLNDNFFVRWDPVVQVQESGTTAQIDHILDQYGGYLERFDIPTTRRGLIQKYVEPNRPQIAQFIQNAVRSFFGFLTNLPSQIMFAFLVPIVTLMILLDMENFRRRGPRWIPPAIRASAMGVLGDIGQVFVKYLRGITTVVLLYTVAQTILMLIAGVPYAFMLGIIFGALYLIPYIGNIISALTLFCVVGFSAVNGNFGLHLGSPWTYALIVLCLYLVIGFTFDHIIYPQMIGNSVGLSPVISLFVIFCGEALFGLPGMIIAFPLAGSAKVILDRLLRVTSSSSENLNLPSVPLRHRPTARQS